MTARPGTTPLAHQGSRFAIWHWPRWVWAVLVPLMLLSYPLSAGPVIWMFNQGYLPRSSLILLMVLYSPLETACEQVPLLDWTIGTYVRWWRDL